MKNKKCLTYAIILILLAVTIAPSINASIAKKSITVENKEIVGFGSIHGSTHYLLGWGAYELPFTLVVAESEGITRQDRSNILSNYRINNLPLDKTYTVTASSNFIIEQQGKYYELISESRTVTLTEGEPNIELNFALKTNQVESFHVDKTKVISNPGELDKEKTGKYGSISGDVLIHNFPPLTPIAGAKIVLQGEHNQRTTYSGPLGNYRFNFVPVGRQYTLTVTHPKFKTVVETFTLSADKPNLNIGITMMDNDNAKIIEIGSESVNKDKTKKELINEDSINRDINQDESCGGTIYGHTIESHDTWGAYPVPFALVDAGIKKTISGPLSNYRITGLPLNQEITITASKKGYHSDTIKHTFTELHPTYYYCFDLQEDEDDSTKEKNVVETTCLGSIYGSAGTSYGWGFSPVFFAKITAGGRTTISLPFDGEYRIKNLPLGTYTITGSKIGYDTFTDTVTLTKDRPNKQVFIHMEPNDENVNKEKIANEKIVENDDSIGYGRVSGMVNTVGFLPMEISGAKFVLEGGLTKRITFSGPLGFYRFNFVTVGRQYTLTVSHPDYKTESTSFYLSPDDPFKIISFSLYEKEITSKSIEEPACLGSIYGNTGEQYIWGFSPVRFVKVEAGGKSTISGPLMGEYRIRNLPLGTYTVTGTKKDYETRTETVKLTEGHPDQQCFIHMEPNDESVNKERSTSSIESALNTISNNKQVVPACFGTILGKTGAYSWSGWGPVNNVKITIGSRTKYSKPHFFFTGLALGQTYTVTASKPGWKTQTKEVTLTEAEPIANIQFDLENNGDKNVKNFKLFSSILISTNTWSNFFSTTTFIS